MPNSIKNILAVLLAIITAAIISFCIIVLGHSIIPTPVGIDTNDFESIKSNFHLFEFKHFLFPLIAHGLSTLAASYLVSRYAKTHKFWFALGIGLVFMFASLSLSLRIGHFNWIGIVEIAQYVPLSILGYKLWQQNNPTEKIVP